MDCTGGVRRFVAASLVAASLASAQAMAKPVAVDDARSQRATSQWTRAQAAEIQQRFELAKGIVQRLKPDAARLGLATGWERATLTMLLMQPSSVLMEANAARDYAGVMAMTARHRVEAKALGDASSDLVFKPFTPCRFLDTRSIGGKLAPLPAVRSFDICDERRCLRRRRRLRAGDARRRGERRPDCRARGQHRDRRHEPGRAGLPRHPSRRARHR